MRYLKLIKFSLLVGLFLSLSVGQTLGQQGRLPQLQYYQGFQEFNLADYKDAGRVFSRGANSAFRVGQQRYLDSICYWTMMGECYYHLGNYAEAIQMYEQSLSLYLTYQAGNWQARVQLPPTIQVNNNLAQQARITWGVPGRAANIANIPDAFSVLFGRMDAERVIQTGGMVENAEFKKVDIAEIMRCVALCLHRRRVIKGPTNKYDPFTTQLINGLNVAGTGNGTLLGAFNGICLGIAHASNEDWKRAAKVLNASLQLKGQLDHPLTPVGLLELANIGLETDNQAVAAQLALEASYSAAVFNQFDLVEESLSLGTTIHLMSSKTPYPPLENAIKWAANSRTRSRLTQASLIVRLAECLAEGGQADLAATVLRQANGPISTRNSLGNCVVSARLKYVSALIQFLKANFRGGMSDLTAALKHFQTGSLWLYRLGLANNLVANGSINQRQADLLYGALLRDPDDNDWKRDPFESIAFLASSHVGALEVWFDIVADRKDTRRALQIADLVRRHRFFASLPMGGRLMSFRWVLHAPEEALSDEAREQKRNFLNKNPTYFNLSKRAELIRDSLLALPLNPEPKSKEAFEKQKLFVELHEISTTQEAILASYSLRREPAEMVFPPQMNFTDIQDKIEEDQIALVTLATRSGYHVILVSDKATKIVGLFDGRKITRGVADLLKKLKASEIALDVKDFEEDEWKESAKQLKGDLFPNVGDASWQNFRELVIIPDGVLWYVPFEAVPLFEGEEEKYLSEVVDVRYAPTLSLAFGVQRPWEKVKNTGVVTSRFFARSDNEAAVAEFGELTNDLPNAAQLVGQLKTPTNYFASVFDQLVVWSEMKQVKGAAYALNPTQIDQSKTGQTISGWMALPWWGPTNIVLPGFHSDGGQGLRTKQNGQDMFFTSLGLMASGSRSILISRWATGGKTSLELTRRYATRIGKVGAAEAIREARAGIREQAVQYDLEPRVRSKKDDPVIEATHPYFWASSMLIATPEGPRPQGADDEEEPEANNPQNPEAMNGGGQPEANPGQAGDQAKPVGDQNAGDQKAEEVGAEKAEAQESKGPIGLFARPKKSGDDKKKLPLP